MIRCDTFNIDIAQSCPGIEDVTLRLGSDTEILFHASYVGQEPLTSMLDSLCEFECGYEDEVKYSWHDEPGIIKFYVRKTSSLMLSISIYKDKAEDGINIEQWHICLPYQVYKQGIINAALSALKRYGCKGFNANWADETGAFFIGKLISILTPMGKLCDDENYHTDIKTELQALLNAL